MAQSHPATASVFGTGGLGALGVFGVAAGGLSAIAVLVVVPGGVEVVATRSVAAVTLEAEVDAEFGLVFLGEVGFISDFCVGVGEGALHRGGLT
jgi:hypothetical protein